MSALRLLKVFYRTSVQTDMEYRADFFARLVASLLGVLTTVGSLSIAFHYTTQIRGWSFPRVLVLLAVYYAVDGLIEMFIAPNMREIMNQVREGTLDFVLLKPVNAQFMATFRTLNVWRAPNLLVGLGLGTYAIQKLSLSVGPAQAGAFIVTLIAGIGVIYSFWLVLVTTTFWFVRIDNIEQIVWQAFEAGRYPVEIYPGWLRAGLTYVVPVVFVITVPARALTGQWPHSRYQDPLQFIGVSLVVSVAALILSSAFWRFGLKHYTGASA